MSWIRNDVLNSARKSSHTWVLETGTQWRKECYPVLGYEIHRITDSMRLSEAGDSGTLRFGDKLPWNWGSVWDTQREWEQRVGRNCSQEFGNQRVHLRSNTPTMIELKIRVPQYYRNWLLHTHGCNIFETSAARTSNRLPDRKCTCCFSTTLAFWSSLKTPTSCFYSHRHNIQHTQSKSLGPSLFLISAPENSALSSFSYILKN